MIRRLMLLLLIPLPVSVVSLATGISATKGCHPERSEGAQSFVVAVPTTEILHFAQNDNNARPTSDRHHEDMIASGVAEFTAANQAWDGAGFAKAAATLAAGSESSINQYWRGVAEFHRLLWLLGETPATNRQETAKALAATITTLQRAVVLDSRHGEARALLGTAYGLSIGANPARGLWLGKRVVDQEKVARKLSPDNPRVMYLAGMNRYYGPSIMGGKDEGLKLLLAAEKLFEAEAGKPAGPVEPRWGRSTCLVYIGKTYDALGKPAEAEEYFRKALKLNPQDKLAKSELEKRKK